MYNGNPKLLGENESVNFEPWQVQEIIRCQEDFIYFARTYCKIIDLDIGLVNFNPYAFQEDMVKIIQDNRYSIFNLPRRSGKTTTVAALILHYILFNFYFKAAILAHKEEQAQEILKMVKLMYEELPLWLQQGVKRWNERDIEIANGSTVVSSATSSSALRGKGVSLLFLDEFAFIPTNIQDSFMASVYPTIASGSTTKIVIASTPNGFNMFYKLYSEAVDGKNRFFPKRIKWNDVPGRDEAWKQEQIRNIGIEKWKQEFEAEFLGSSHTLIDSDKLRQLAFKTPIDSSPDGFFRVYERPEKDAKYIIVGDVSQGLGQDFSAFVVFNVSAFPYRVAATFKCSFIKPMILPRIIAEVGKNYNNAYVLVESNDAGIQVNDILFYDLEYDYVFGSSSAPRIGQTVKIGPGTRLGVMMTKQVKTIGCFNLKALIENDKLLVGDEWCIYELARFSSDGKTYRAEEGNDDLVMCMVSFGWLVEQEIFKQIAETNIRSEMVEYQKKILEEEYKPIGVYNDNLPDLNAEANQLLNNFASDDLKRIDDWLKEREQVSKMFAQMEREKVAQNQSGNWLNRFVNKNQRNL